MTARPVTAPGLAIPAPGGVTAETAPRRRRRSGTAPTAARQQAAQTRRVGVDGQPMQVLVDLAESPLAWLARRRDKAGHPMISDLQFLAGERLRVDFTRAGLTPRVTTDWSALGSSGGGGPATFSDAVLNAKARLTAALVAVGPELSGVLLDVCCFLKGLEAVEGERQWPARTAKVVLGLGLDRLARHYGLTGEAHGRPARTRAWHASPPSPADAVPPDDSLA